MSRKTKTTLIASLLVLSLASYVNALPELESVTEGSADFAQEGSTLTVTVHTEQLIANYHSFSIAENEIVQFIQPSISSSALNRVTGDIPSLIYGALIANGSIFLINPAGITFGATAQINAGSFVASTLDISDANFLAGKYEFEGLGGYIINQGVLTVHPDGYLCLLSGAVRNDGKIWANLSTVILAAGEKMVLDLDPEGEIRVVIEEAVKNEIFGPDGIKMDSAVENTGEIKADGGKVILTAKVLNDVFDYAINNSGIIEAGTLDGRDGEIVLSAEGAPIINTGTIKGDDIQIDIPDAGFINEGEIVANGSEVDPNGGIINIAGYTVFHSGLISADAYEGGTAGTIAIVAEGDIVFDENSTTSAACPLPIYIGNGGNIYITSTRGNTYINRGALIDVSAGSVQGDGGYIKIGAFDQLGFYGILSGRAPPGYTSADVLLNTNLPYEPSLIDTYSLLIDGQINAGNIFISTNQRLNISGNLTAQGTIQVNSQGADINGTYSANQIVFNMQTGDTELAGDFNGDTSFFDLGNITVVDDLVVTNGNLGIFADHTSASLDAWHDGSGDLIHDAGVIQTIGSGSITLAGANVYLYSTDTVISDSGNIDVIANNSSAGEHSVEIEVWGSITSTSGDISLTATNIVTRNIITTYFEDYSSNYAEIEVDADITSGTGDISLTATNIVNTTVTGGSPINEYYDYSENYAEIDVEGSGGTISTIGNINFSANNSVTRNITADYIDYFYDSSYNYAYLDIYDTLDTTSDGTSPGTVTLTATNNVDNTLTVNGYIEYYYDYSENYADIYLESPDTILTDLGDVNITADNSLISNISADYIDYFRNSSDNYAKVYLYYMPIYSGSGDVNLAATNTVDTTLTVTDPVIDPITGDISYEGGIYRYYDYSENYAEIDVEGSGGTISTIGNIDFSADNSVIREITLDNIDYSFRDRSENYAYLDIYDTLDTTSDGTSPGTVTLTATNNVDNTLLVNDSINYYYDYSDNYADIYLESPDTILTDLGDINITADNSLISDISADYINYFRNSSDNYAEVYLYYMPIYSDSGDVNLFANNIVNTTVTAVDDGEGGIDGYYDYSENYAEIEVEGSGGTISTTGNIDFSANNSVTRNITADYIDYFYDSSYNYAYLDIYDTLDTTSDGTSPGTVTLTATNNVDNTLTVNGYIEYYYDYSDNYADIYLESPDTILTDLGDINITADNSLISNISADYIDYFRNSSDNYAKVYLYYMPIYSDSGDVNLFANNIVNTTVTAVDDGEGGIDGYYDYSENFAEIDVEGSGETISTTGNIVFSATNSVTKDTTAESVAYYEDSSYNYADIEIIDTLTTTPDGAKSSGEINISATNTVNNTLDSDNIGESYDDSDNYAEVELSGSTLYTDAGDINITASSTGTGEHEADVDISTPIISNSGDITVTAQADNYSKIWIYSTVSTDTGNINMVADDYEIGGETIISYAGGNITLENASDGRPIVLGAVEEEDGDGNGYMWIDQDEISLIITDGLITIGSETAGPIIVGDVEFGTDVALISGDDITIYSGTLTSTGGVTLATYGGSIIPVGSGPHVVAGGDSLIIIFGGTIGSLDQPLDVDITGILTLDTPNAGVVDLRSGTLTGSVAGVYPVLINTSFPSPQFPAGEVYFNNILIWPPTIISISSIPGLSSFTLAQLIETLLRRFEGLNDYSLNNYLLASFDTGSPLFFFYHPLAVIDASLFDGIILDEEAYEFIENLLKLKGPIPPYFGISE